MENLIPDNLLCGFLVAVVVYYNSEKAEIWGDKTIAKHRLVWLRMLKIKLHRQLELLRFIILLLPLLLVQWHMMELEETIVLLVFYALLLFVGFTIGGVLADGLKKPQE